MILNVKRLALNCKRSFKIFFIIILVGFNILASEYIKSFDVIIKVEKTGLLTVTENITVRSYLNQIKHGIFRSIPTKYKQDTIFNYNIDLQVLSVLKDAKAVNYEVLDGQNGKFIKIGSQYEYLTPGEHTYQISYAVDRQIGFFENYSELYWNVTGNGWPFIIKQATVKVILPENIPNDKINFEAYTGYSGDTYRFYRANIKDNIITFQTTKQLLPNQGLTIVANWPHGYIEKPTQYDNFVKFMADNWHIFWYLLAFILLVIYSILSAIFIRSKLIEKPIIPLFHAPKNLTPGALRYILEKEWYNKCLAADIVDMAVKGLLTIDQDAGYFSTDYILEKKQDSSNFYYNKLLNLLFAYGDKLTIKSGYNAAVNSAVDYSKIFYEHNYGRYFNPNWETVGVFFSIAALLFLIPLSIVGFEAFGSIFLILSILLFFIVKNLVFVDTQEGLNLRNEILGFKMYLETAESDRLKFLSTPPTKTPELYETLLPYAIALGVEQEWSKQFAPIFKEMQATGHIYRPIWFHGNFVNFNPSFTSDFSYAMSQNISSSQYAPGAKSGSFGGGRSGGGGGGGGGGGW